MSRHDYLSSSPSKLFDQLFEEAGVQPPPPPATATSQVSGTGWTPYIDKVFMTNMERTRAPGSSPGNFETHEMRTPAPDKTLKLSDFFIDTPTMNQYDLNALLGIENDNKENHPLFANMDTPNFKTPLHELTHTPKLLQSTSVRRLSARTTPSNFKTPLKEHHQSSPSTIVLASAQKQQPAPQMSPTPVAKSQFKSAPCQLVKSASNMEPVIGIFQDQKPVPPPRRRPDPGSGKFQIIFTDMNTLKGSYGAKKNKKRLARTTSAVENPGKRKKLVKYNSESAKDTLWTDQNN